MQGLKRRIEQLESLQQAKRWRPAQLEQSGPLGASVSDVNAATQSNTAPSDPLARRDAQNARNGSNSGGFGQLAISSIAADAAQTPGAPAGSFSMVQIVNEALKHGSASVRDHSDQRTREAEGALRDYTGASSFLFSRVTTCVFFEQYLSLILTRYPWADEDRLKRYYEHVVQEHERSSSPRRLPKNAHRFFAIYIAVATIANALSPSPTLSAFATSLSREAVSLVPDVLHLSDPTSIVQCLTALAICSLYNFEVGQVHHLLGIAATKAVSMGLHRIPSTSPTETPRSSPHEACRLFWVLYLLDW